VEERQKIKVAKETDASSSSDYDPVAAAKYKAEFLLTFHGHQVSREVCRILIILYLQCFDTVGRASGRASGL